MIKCGLCNNYDNSNKEYVTIADMSETITWLLITFVVSYGYFFGFYDCVFNGFRITNTSPITSEIANFVFVIGSAILIIVSLFLLLLAISEIKIAKCKLKDE